MNIKQKIVSTATVGAMAISMLAMSGVANAQYSGAVSGGIQGSNPFARGAGYLQSTAAGAGVQNGDLPTIIGRIINIVLGLLGVIFLVLAIYAGFKWMTAAGEEGPIEEAKDTLKNAVIGVVIVMASYALSSFVLGQIQSAAGQ